jgi:hypothetical protein
MDESPKERNFAHLGCLFGSIVGLSVGVVSAWLLASRAGSIVLALMSWVGLTIVLAAVGYVVGGQRSRSTEH